MTKTSQRWIIVLGILLFLFIVFLSIKLFNNPKSVTQKETEQTQAWTWSSIEQAEAEIMSMVDNHRYAEAKRAINQLLSDFSQNSQLPKSLFWIAERYRWSDELEEAINLYNKIIQDYPQSSYVRKAEIGIAREEVMALLRKNDYGGAQRAVNALISRFSGDPDLAESLYWIADKYKWAERYDEAKKLYKEIIWNYPKSSYIDKAKLNIAAGDLEILIRAEDFAETQKALDKLVIDFAKDPDLPKILCRIADIYHWDEHYEQAKNLFSMVIRNYPNSSVLDRAKFGFAREEIALLIVSQNYIAAQKAAGEMITNFTDNPDLPEMLFWVAEKYAWAYAFFEKKKAYSDAYKEIIYTQSEAQNLYQQIIKNYPNSLYANKSKLGFATAEIISHIMAGDCIKVKKAFDKLTMDFLDHPDLDEATYKMRDAYFYKIDSMYKSGDIKSVETFMKSVVQNLNITPIVKSATNQEDLANKVFDSFQKFENSTGLLILNEVFIPPSPYWQNQREFNEILDLIEKKWLSFQIDDYYDDVGIFLLWLNIVVGRFEKVDTIFMRMKENLSTKGINSYFYSGTIMKFIDGIALSKKFYAPREDLSLLYAAKMAGEVYAYQKRHDKSLEAFKLIADNYKGTKGGKLFNAICELKKAELECGSRESIPQEERKRLTNNILTAMEEMEKD